MVFFAFLDALKKVKEQLKDRDIPVVSLQGGMNNQQWQTVKKRFDSKEYMVLLVSRGAGSEGLNFSSASRVILYDIGWNKVCPDQGGQQGMGYLP